jgi:protein-disulfide isomerase
MNDIEVKSKGVERSQPLLMWALFFFIIGGLVGWTLGRQAAPSSPQANGPVTVNANPLAAATTPGSETAVNNSIAPSTGPTPASITPETIKTLGDPDAPVTIVEFSDYQCPFCMRNFQETFPQIKTEFIDTGRVFYVFKDFPIAGLHPLAYRLHEAALCAGEAGESVDYWQAHDLFFSKSEVFKLNSLAEMDAAIQAEFETAGLSTEGLSECLQSNRHAAAVQAGIAEGQSLGVSGTPTFFINGYPIVGARPYQVFQQAIMLAEEGRLAAEFAASTAPTQVPPAQPVQPVTVPLSDEPAKGDPNAPVTIVEYSDYQCPFCLRHFDNTMPSLQQYIDAGQVRYVFKDFPIHSIHPQAQKAHEAARCARELGGDDAYWAMHDLLFTNQEAWAQTSLPEHVAVLKSLAGEAGLSQAEFDACLDSGKYYDAINVEVNEGVQLGVRGTPTFFINGQLLSGAQPFSVFQQAIESFLNQQ